MESERFGESRFLMRFWFVFLQYRMYESGAIPAPAARPYENVLEEMKMPHIIVKLHPGRSEEQKQHS
jgi:hypothetical protein